MHISRDISEARWRIKSHIRPEVCLTVKPKNKLSKLSSFANVTNLFAISEYVEDMFEWPSEYPSERFT